MNKKNVINPLNIDIMLFNYFSSKEFFPSCSCDEVFDCVHNGHFDNLLILVQVLDNLREYIGYPITITSSYRNTLHNKKVGGSPTSQHLYAAAIDFVCPKVPFSTLKCYVREFLSKSALERFVGQVIFYNKRNFIHIGLRTPSHPHLIYLNYEQRDN